MKTIVLACGLCGALLASSPGARPSAGEAPGSTAPPAPAVPAATANPCGALAELERMDTRTAVPLLPMMADHQKRNMRDHLLAVEEIVLAAAGDDFAAIEKSVSRIGYSEAMGQMCTHMGKGAPGFTEQALRFHRTADTIAEAARRRDRPGVLRALGATLGTCTGCHAAYQQRVVDAGTWERLTGASEAPAAGGTGHH